MRVGTSDALQTTQTVATLTPGVWDADQATPSLARDPTRFANDLGASLTAGLRFQLIDSFNLWADGSAVEGAAQWASDSGQGTYLDVLHDHPIR